MVLWSRVINKQLTLKSQFYLSNWNLQANNIKCKAVRLYICGYICIFKFITTLIKKHFMSWWLEIIIVWPVYGPWNDYPLFIPPPAVINRHRGALMCDVNLFLPWNMSRVIFLFCFLSCMLKPLHLISMVCWFEEVRLLMPFGSCRRVEPISWTAYCFLDPFHSRMNHAW